MSDLYETDALAWSERQAALLRQLADGQRVNELIDWSNVIEEVEDVGRSELHSCQSLLRQALVHLLKAQVWPDSEAAPHWRGEVSAFLADARKRFSPSMRRRLGLDDIYADALDQVRVEAGQVSDTLPETCPCSLDDLLAKRPVIAELARRFASPGRLAPRSEGA